MAKQSPALHSVGKTSELAPGEAKQVRIGGRSLALYNIDGTFYATDDTCTHAFASLSEGYIDGDTVECPLHQGCFHIPSGKAMGPPVTQDVRTYAVKVVDEEIYIEVPQETNK
jgi:nitrite reductase/ring-hydroxylating ferredoxin subunit